MDIDVEHGGQRTKVTPPAQSEEAEAEGDVEMDGASCASGGSQSSKVSLSSLLLSWDYFHIFIHDNCKNNRLSVVNTDEERDNFLSTNHFSNVGLVLDTGGQRL